jgi:hypothetical protein
MSTGPLLNGTFQIQNPCLNYPEQRLVGRRGLEAVNFLPYSDIDFNDLGFSDSLTHWVGPGLKRVGLLPRRLKKPRCFFFIRGQEFIADRQPEHALCDPPSHGRHCRFPVSAA